MESHGSSWKVNEGQEMSRMVFSNHWIDILGEKSYGWWPVGLYCQPQSLSSGFWILDLGLGFGTGLGLDNYHQSDPVLHFILLKKDQC